MRINFSQQSQDLDVFLSIPDCQVLESKEGNRDWSDSLRAGCRELNAYVYVALESRDPFFDQTSVIQLPKGTRIHYPETAKDPVQISLGREAYIEAKTGEASRVRIPGGNKFGLIIER